MTNYNLKIWRILACAGVLITHISIRLHLQGNMLDLAYMVGYFGLIIFYMMSGYLLCFSQELRIGNIAKYWIKRAIKILPLYYLVICIYFIIETYVYDSVPINKTGFGWKRYIFCFFDLVNTDEKFWRNLGFTWTIQIFLIFYLIAPLLYKLVDKYWKAWAAVFFFFALSVAINKYMGGNLRALTYMHYCVLGLVLYFTQKEGKQRTTIFISSVAVLLFYTLISQENVLIDLNNNLYSFLFMALFVATENICINSRNVKKIIDFLEPYTFTFYLMQGMVWEEIICRKSCSNIEVVMWLIVGTGMLCFIVYNVYEKPVQKILKKILLSKKQE